MVKKSKGGAKGQRRSKGGRGRSFWSRLVARRQGGPVLAGQPVLVGEAGPEIIVPRSAGFVVSNRASGMGRPGGNGRLARVTRSASRPFAALAQKRPKWVSVGKKVGAAGVWGGVAFAVAEVMDRVKIPDAVQGGIFAGVALVLAGFGATAAAAGVAAIAVKELLYAGYAWVKNKYPGVLPGGTTPAPATP